MIRNCGELGIEFNDIRGDGARVTREFLRKLIQHIVAKSTRYYDETGRVGVPEHVFAYRERQLHSVVCPAIADITACFLVENPLNRKPAGEAEYRGSADYWIYYEGLLVLDGTETYLLCLYTRRCPSKEHS